MALQLRKHDLQRKVRVRRTGNLILFVVDASWSMAASERMEATKGAIFSLLVDAYQRRDQVGLVVFQRDRARLVLPAHLQRRSGAAGALRDLPVGGKTPLSSGLLPGVSQVLRRGTPTRQRGAPDDDSAHRRRGQRQHDRPACGRRRPGASPACCTRPASTAWWSTWSTRPSTAAWPTRWPTAMGAPCYCLPDLAAESLVRTVKREISI
jgi:hypothetical protein